MTDEGIYFATKNTIKELINFHKQNNIELNGEFLTFVRKFDLNMNYILINRLNDDPSTNLGCYDMGRMKNIDLILQNIMIFLLAKDPNIKNKSEFKKIQMDIDYLVYLSRKSIDNYQFCCSKKMLLDSDRSEMLCRMCGNLFILREVAFHKNHFFSNEGNKNNHNHSNTVKNFIKWLDNIMGKNGSKIPDSDKKKIFNKIKNDYPHIAFGQYQLNIKDIRKYLVLLDLTRYNSYASYLLIILTNKKIPNFDSNDIKKICETYKEVISIHNQITNNNNLSYYPYYIYKIIEVLFCDDEEKLKIVHFIHFQKSNTVIKQDKYWKYICEKLGFLYKRSINFDY